MKPWLTTLLALLLSPIVQADPECYSTEQEIRGEDGTVSTRTVQSCRDPSGRWTSTVIDDPDVDTERQRLLELKATLERQLEENEQAHARLQEVQRELEALDRQQRYWTLVEDVATRLADKKEWKAGRIGDTPEYGVAVPGTRLPVPMFVFIRFVEANDTVQYSVFHPELSYTRLSLSGLPVPPSLGGDLLASAAAELDRSSRRSHLGHWALLPDAQSHKLSVNVTAPIALLDAAQVMDDVAWLASHIGGETIAVLKVRAGSD